MYRKIDSLNNEHAFPYFLVDFIYFSSTQLDFQDTLSVDDPCYKQVEEVEVKKSGQGHL